MSLLRSVAAVVAGYLVFALPAGLLFAVSGVNPHGPQSLGVIAGAAVFGMVCALVAGVAAIRIAGRRPVMHAALVSGLIALGAAVSLLTSPASDATWSQWGAILLMAPSAALAPWIARR